MIVHNFISKYSNYCNFLFLIYRSNILIILFEKLILALFNYLSIYNSLSGKVNNDPEKLS